MSARKKSANNVQFAKKSLAPPRGISKHAPADGLINANTPWNHIPGPEQSAVLLATPILVCFFFFAIDLLLCIALIGVQMNIQKL